MKRRWVSFATIAVAAGGLAFGTAAFAVQTEQNLHNQLACSTKVPGGTNESQLARLAKISADRARSAALEAVGGNVRSTTLDDEDGCLVYSVETNGKDGKLHDVKVDAGNGHVVSTQIESKADTERENAGENGAETESGEGAENADEDSGGDNRSEGGGR